MKHPFWILNSALLFLFILVIGFIFFSYQTIPEREDIEPEAIIKPRKITVSKIAAEKIYENDPFGTTLKKPIQPEEIVEAVVAMPAPPQPTPIQVPQEEKVEFLEPLGVLLKGIVAFALDETKNRAIIADTKTNVEKMYKVGDKIEDAQLIRIFSNKVLFIRSNGQQEVIYLREKDAINDPAYAMAIGWQDAIGKIDNKTYTVDPDLFVARVGNLGQLIDMLDLTTVYKKGENIGCRVGDLEENSLGLALGLQKNDIIIAVNNIPATTTTNRFKIYKEITNSDPQAIIEVKLMRNQQEITLKYKLQAKPKEAKAETPIEEKKRKEEQLKSLQKRHTLAPTMQEIRLKERQYMWEHGRKPITPLSKPIE